MSKLGTRLERAEAPQETPSCEAVARPRCTLIVHPCKNVTSGCVDGQEMVEGAHPGPGRPTGEGVFSLAATDRSRIPEWVPDAAIEDEVLTHCPRMRARESWCGMRRAAELGAPSLSGSIHGTPELLQERLECRSYMHGEDITSARCSRSAGRSFDPSGSTLKCNAS